MRQTVPNCITFLRMAGALCLLFVQPLSAAFYAVYTACGISDVLDGMIARATDSASALGAKLDSVADLLFFVIVLLRLISLLWTQLPAGLWCGVGAVLLFRICAYIIAALKYRRFASLHTWLNKLAGISLFLVPYLMNRGYFVGYCAVCCAIAGASVVEEWLIHVWMQRYDPDIRTIWQTEKTRK